MRTYFLKNNFPENFGNWKSSAGIVKQVAGNCDEILKRSHDNETSLTNFTPAGSVSRAALILIISSNEHHNSAAAPRQVSELSAGLRLGSRKCDQAQPSALPSRVVARTCTRL